MLITPGSERVKTAFLKFTFSCHCGDENHHNSSLKC